MIEIYEFWSNINERHFLDMLLFGIWWLDHANWVMVIIWYVFYLFYRRVAELEPILNAARAVSSVCNVVTQSIWVDKYQSKKSLDQTWNFLNNIKEREGWWESLPIDLIEILMNIYLSVWYEDALTDSTFFDIYSLAFSVTLFCSSATLAIIIMMIRRHPSIGGELGGPRGPKILTSLMFVGFWVFYVVMSSMEAYGIIKGKVFTHLSLPIHPFVTHHKTS